MMYELLFLIGLFGIAYGLSVGILCLIKFSFTMKKSKDKKKSINWEILLPFAIVPTIILICLFFGIISDIHSYKNY
jgi:heme/copper-type cytochrome/quinol oxidase subunit 2